MKRAPVLVLVVALAVGGGFYAWQRLGAPEAPVLTGYVEGDPLYFAAPEAGPLARLSVSQGDRVGEADPLFAVDPDRLQARLRQAEANRNAAAARLADTRKGRRPVELAIIEAEREAAEAQMTQAKAELARTRPLVARNVSPQAALDNAQAAYDTAVAHRKQAQKNLEAARLGEREDRIRAARAELDAAEAAIAEIQVQLAELNPAAPVAARVEDVFFRPGEWVPAGRPVLSLLPDERVRIRFFVPEAEVARYRPGEPVTFSCDGCGPPRQAEISYVSPRAEFTPPVIYSRSSRQKLVFLVEAKPDDPGTLAPGLPVDVTPIGDSR
ncbi:HlyD family secretion protein [Amorphus orientalis]|uniref:HlyD family secretion protein n=1 Tax=Amorphus orientalis TaxID=649198 RepID=A0AAE3VS63_9HYPH|nr:HlyD family efflux transporter periplasmic adaptor subunit [Amorphus orientalis]MDQ0317210.1 HlyD family secretion protein [Amorphus orientalis]